jgi:hypothetical protein
LKNKFGLMRQLNADQDAETDADAMCRSRDLPTYNDTQKCKNPINTPEQYDHSGTQGLVFQTSKA